LWPAPGSRHQFVLDLAGALLRSDWSYDEVEEFIITCAMQTGDLEIDDRRRAISDTAKKIVREEAVTGWPSLAERIGDDVTKILRLWLGIKSSKQSLPLTDEGNAQRLVRYFGQDIRYCPEFRTWLVWDSPVWRQDEAGGTGSAITGFSRATAAAIYDEIIKEPDPDKRQQIAKWAVQSGSGNRILMIPKLAKSEVSVQVRQSDLDSDPWKLNCTNGLLDLRTAGLQARSRGDFNTKVAGTHYDPSARCPGWLDHLNLIFNGKQDMITFVHRLFGYTLTGLIDEHIFPILYGQGSNGKSTLLEAIRGVLGGYAKNADSETFMAKQAEGIKTDIARLRGARFVTTVETGQGRRLAIPLVKQITGGDMVTARFLYSPEFEYRPTYKVWMATNHRPVISEDDEGIWRRIRLIPFNVQISVEQRVKDMDERLRAEWPGILAWAVEGCMAWQRHGLGTSEQIDIATATYREDSNNVGQFVDEMCFLEPAAQERSGILYRGYQGWCQGQGQRPVSSNVFKERMEALGPSCRRSSNGVVWTGIRMNLSPELMSSTSRSNPFGVN
jgi:putative DNA primase/helicase